MNTTKKFYRGLGITVIAFGTGVSWTAMNAPFNAASFSLPSFNLAASDPSPNTNSDPRVTDARYAALDERFRKATGVGAKPSEATRYSDSSKAGVTGSPLGFNLVGQVASASNGANGTSADCEAAPISSASAAARNGQSNFTAGDGNACSSGGDLPNTSSIPTFSMGSAMAWNQPVDPNLDPIPGPTPFPSPAPIPGPIILPPIPSDGGGGIDISALTGKKTNDGNGGLQLGLQDTDGNVQGAKFKGLSVATVDPTTANSQTNGGNVYLGTRAINSSTTGDGDGLRVDLGTVSGTNTGTTTSTANPQALRIGRGTSSDVGGTSRGGVYLSGPTTGTGTDASRNQLAITAPIGTTPNNMAVADVAGIASSTGQILHAAGNSLLAQTSGSPVGLPTLGTTIPVKLADAVSNVGATLSQQGLSGLKIVGQSVGKLTRSASSGAGLAKVVVLNSTAVGDTAANSRQLLAVNAFSPTDDATKNSTIAADVLSGHNAVALAYDGSSLIAIPLNGGGTDALSDLAAALGPNGTVNGGIILGVTSLLSSSGSTTGAPMIAALTPITDAIAGLPATVNGIQLASASPVGGLVNSVKTVADGATGASNSQAGTAVSGVTSGIGGTVAGVGSTISDVAGGVSGTVSGVANTAGAVVGGVAGGVGAVVGSVTGGTGSSVVGGTVGSVVGGAVGTVGSVLSGTSGAGGTTGSVLSGTSGASGTLGSVVGGVGSTLGTTVGTVNSVVGSTTNTVGGVVGGAVNTVNSVTGGVNKTLNNLLKH